MTFATLADALRPAHAKDYAVAGMVALGWEAMRAFVTAAEAEGVRGEGEIGFVGYTGGVQAKTA